MKKILAFTLLTLLICTVAAWGQSVKVTWDANTEPDLAGYKLYMGNQPGDYTAPIDVGNVTEYQVSDLPENTTYYFAVTAYDNGGLESGFSNEASYAVPNLPPVAPTGCAVVEIAN